MQIHNNCGQGFSTETNLVEAFISHLGSGTNPWGVNCFLREFDYTSGRTDILSLSTENEVLAFEAKLSDWKKAIHQAWRNTSFAHKVFVVLPRNKAKLAEKNRSAFVTRGVGLCIVDDSGIEVLIDSDTSDPVMPWLNKKALQALTDSHVQN